MAQKRSEGLRSLVSLMARSVDDAKDVERGRLVALDRHCPLGEGQGLVQAMHGASLIYQALGFTSRSWVEFEATGERAAGD